ncbi:MAG: hypothetical protein LRZ88_03185, partial [Candidatus Cloacimonetes bacterium]|nr:hypothetical protein [Candidatus Cloacimonadota bacterium]
MPKERINHQISADKVRLIGSDGKQIGVVSLREALRRAEEAELDLGGDFPPISIPPFAVFWISASTTSKK